MTKHEKSAPLTNHEVPENKRTTVGHSVTAEEAYRMWKNPPEQVHILDVRTPEEYVFVGPCGDGGEHPPPFRKTRVER